MKYIYRSFFDANIPFESDTPMIAVAETAKGFAIYNLSNNRIVLNNSKMSDAKWVKKYEKGVSGPELIKDGKETHFLFLDKNIDLTTESKFIDIRQIEKFYGTTAIRKFIQIKQEG